MGWKDAGRKGQEVFDLPEANLALSCNTRHITYVPTHIQVGHMTEGKFPLVNN